MHSEEIQTCFVSFCSSFWEDSCLSCGETSDPRCAHWGGKTEGPRNYHPTGAKDAPARRRSYRVCSKKKKESVRYRPWIQRRIVSKDGSSSSQCPARRSAARRSATTCWSVARANSCCSVACAAFKAAECWGVGRWPQRMFVRAIAHRRTAAARR